MSGQSNMPMVVKPGPNAGLFDVNPFLLPLCTLQKTGIDQQVPVLVLLTKSLM